VAERAGEPTLAGAGLARDQQVLPPRDPIAGGELGEESSVEAARGLGVEVLDRRVLSEVGGPVEEIRPGDIVWFEPDEKHWHGAAPDPHGDCGDEGRMGPDMDGEGRRPRLPWKGAVMADDRSPAQKAYGDIAPALADLSDRVLFGEVWERPGLSKRDRCLITVASLIALYRINELPGHVRRALANGVTREELVELVTHLAFYGGWPVANSAIPILRKAFEEAGA
jgi:4-carboxymuconolactone decarboxylase